MMCKLMHHGPLLLSDSPKKKNTGGQQQQQQQQPQQPQPQQQQQQPQQPQQQQQQQRWEFGKVMGWWHEWYGMKSQKWASQRSEWIERCCVSWLCRVTFKSLWCLGCDVWDYLQKLQTGFMTQRGDPTILELSWSIWGSSDSKNSRKIWSNVETPLVQLHGFRTPSIKHGQRFFVDTRFSIIWTDPTVSFSDIYYS